MKLALEVPVYSAGEARGSAIYAANLLRGIAALKPPEPVTAFAYYSRDHASRGERLRAQLPPGVRLVTRRWPQRLVKTAEQGWGYPFVDRHFLRPEGIDVFHDTGLHPVDTRRTAVVHTVHGTAMSLHGTEPFFDKVVAPALRRCARVIVLGKVCRDFLIKYYGIPESKLAHITFGIDHALFRPIEDRGVLERAAKARSLPEKFLLCVGPFQFRDNVEHVLTVLERRRDAPELKDQHLVLAGGLEEYGAALRARVEASPLASRVRFLGHVPHAELAVLYNLATAVIHPSYYEELGAVPREAGASGAPVLASAAGGNHEAIGDGAVYFDPHSLDDLDAQLRRVLSSPALRAELSERGKAYCRQFTLEESARKTLECYRQAAGERS